MISGEAAQKIAEDWVAAWNSHDLDAIMSHYAETVDFWSPLIARRFGVETGNITDKTQLRAYFAGGLAASPDLHFTILKVFAGVDSVTITYGRHDGSEAAEMMVVDEEGHITQARAHYHPPK